MTDNKIEGNRMEVAMAKQKPLSRSRLHEILSCYKPGVTMEMVGGYDTGVYFAFRGKSIRKTLAEDRFVGGRIISDHGFCSEAIVLTRAQFRSRGGADHDIQSFFARCEARRATLQRWLSEFEPI